ncbi:MAG TPA: hypothetical protein VGI81_23485 [Tepidisphaeraceae bacterium]|jgi:hypothetical protein
MFPLAGKSFPTSPQDLAAAIRKAMAEVISFPAKADPVRAEGGTWPSIDRVALDLTGAMIDPTKPPPAPPTLKGERQPGIKVGRLEVRGQPILIGKSEVNLALDGHNVGFDFARDAAGDAMLVLRDAKDGHVQVEAGKDDLQAMLRAAATTAGKPHGITIQDLQLTLTSDGPRSIGVEARVKAKKMVMSGTVVVRGKADVDDQLVATLSNLACTGEGMIGGMAAALVGSKLKAFEGKRVPLMAFSLGETKLRDVRISTGKTIRVNAEFGSA